MVRLKNYCSSNGKHCLVYLQETVSENEVAEWLVQYEPILQNATISNIGLLLMKFYFVEFTSAKYCLKNS